MAKREFKPGEIVRLKSGGQEMVVVGEVRAVEVLFMDNMKGAIIHGLVQATTLNHIEKKKVVREIKGYDMVTRKG